MMPSEPSSQLYNQVSIKEAMKLSVDVFGGVLLPEECTKKFSPVHQQMWQELTGKVDSTLEDYVRFAIALPRGHAKTQLMKFLIIYCIVYTNRRYIMVVCNTASMARTLIHDVLSLLSSDNAVKIFGDWRYDIEKDADEYRKFSFNGRKVILKPMGIGSSLRGTNIDNTRPDVILCDDMQSLEESQSEEVAKGQLQWFLGTLLKARSPRRCTVIYVGNMYPDLELKTPASATKVYGCILRNLELNSQWTTWITGAVLSDGRALWPEVWPIEALMSDLEQDMQMGMAHIWYAEVMNSPQPLTNHFFDPEKVPEYPYTDTDLVIGKYLMIDPSLGKKDSDAQYVGLFYVYDDTGPCLVELREMQVSAPELVKSTLLWAIEERVPLVMSENFGYQGSLLQWFEYFANEINLEGIMFLGIRREGSSKNAAIIGSFKQVMKGNLHLHPRVRTQYFYQAQYFKPTTIKNVDDILDLAEYGERIFLTYQTEWLVHLELSPFATRLGSSAPAATQNWDPATHNFYSES